MRVIKLCLGMVLFLLLGPGTSYACSCLAPQPVTEAVAQASAVFSGKVIRIKQVKRENRQDELGDLEVFLAVKGSWKGELPKVVRVFTSSSSAACGYGFKKGNTYLVYARAGAQGELATNICTRTKRLKDAREDMQELNAGKGARKS